MSLPFCILKNQDHVEGAQTRINKGLFEKSFNIQHSRCYYNFFYNKHYYILFFFIFILSNKAILNVE